MRVPSASKGGRRRIRLTTVLLLVPCVLLAVSTLLSAFLITSHLPTDRLRDVVEEKGSSARELGIQLPNAAPEAREDAPDARAAPEDHPIGLGAVAESSVADSAAAVPAAVPAAVESALESVAAAPVPAEAVVAEPVPESASADDGVSDDSRGDDGVELEGGALDEAAEAEAAALLAAGQRAEDSGFAFSVTIITQTTPDRLRFLREMADRWAPHPLVAAVYLPLGVSADAIEAAVHGEGLRPHLRLVLRAQLKKSEPYPINELRNLAIAAASTTHFLTLDVDLWPSAGLHEAFARQSTHLLRSNHTAFVVPAFAFYATHHAARADEVFEAKSAELPHTLAELERCMDRGNCTTFYFRSSPETHSSTDYAKWWNWTEPGRTFPIPCMRSTRYEPYVIVPRLPGTPRYNPRFNGYGKNKIEFVINLRYLGFRFNVLPGAFVTHMQHSKSELKEEWENSATHHRDAMDALFREFVEELHWANRKTRKVPDCTPRQPGKSGKGKGKPKGKAKR